MERANPEEFRRLSSGSHGLSELEALGLVRRVEAVVVLVQTADEVLLLEQRYERAARRIVWNDRNLVAYKQSEYRGRTKMYGGDEPQGGVQ